MVKDLLKRITSNEPFSIWAAQVIGRACIVRGPQIKTPALESKTDRQIGVDTSLSEAASYAGVLKCLEAALWQDDVQIAASAEQTLQAIASNPHDSRSEAFITARQDYQILEELQYGIFVCPRPSSPVLRNAPAPTLESWQHVEDAQIWCSHLAVALCSQMKSDPVLDVLGPFASTAPSVSPSMIPYIVHLVLTGKQTEAHGAKEKLSGIFAHILASEDAHVVSITPIVLKTILYLRRCQMPTESTLAHRNLWLDVDFAQAAEAATRCQFWHTALLCIEIKQAQQHLQVTRSSRRSTQSSPNAVPGCLPIIYQSVDDPDFFYAGHHDADMHSVIKRLAHESASQRMLSFQSAIFDSAMRSEQSLNDTRTAAMITARALSIANMQSISQAVGTLASGISRPTSGHGTLKNNQTNAVWNIDPSEDDFNSASAMSYLHTLATATDIGAVVQEIERGLLNGARNLVVPGAARVNATKTILPLAILSEAKDL